MVLVRTLSSRLTSDYTTISFGRADVTLDSAFHFFAVTTIIYALAFFIPTIIQSMGYSTGTTLLMSAPPAVAAVPWVLFVSWLADKTHTRSPWIILQAAIGIVGLIVIGYAENNGARYFGVFLGVAASNANIPTSLAWQANNIRGQSLRMYESSDFFPCFVWFRLGG